VKATDPDTVGDRVVAQAECEQLRPRDASLLPRRDRRGSAVYGDFSTYTRVIAKHPY
jgi:hypothetical protein